MKFDDDNAEKPSFFQKNKTAIFIGAGILVAVAVGVSFMPKSTPKKKSSSVVSISLPPPPPPPPPQPPPPPPKEQPPEPEVQQEETFQPEEAEPEPQAADPEPAPMGTNIEGLGNDGFGLAKGGGGGLIGGKGGGGKKGSKFGAYSAQVQSSVVQALRSHKKTKSASMNVTARIWLDASGRVTRAALSGSSGDAATDAAIKEEILTGLKFQAPPPDGMPMPIVMRLKATRPN